MGNSSQLKASAAKYAAALGLSEDMHLLAARTEDMAVLCEKTGQPRFSAFLTEPEAAVASGFLESAGIVNFVLYGGCENAERKILGIFPDYLECDCLQFPVCAVKFYGRGIKGLTHRDYLGALMSLGVARNAVGDIVCGEDETYAMLLPAAAELALSMEKIGRAGVKTDRAELNCVVRQFNFSQISGTVASMRLDCILSLALRVSREKAAGLIRSGAVSVNHSVTENVSEPMRENDVISARGYGRFILAQTGGKTKKDRLHVTVKKFER